MVLMAANKTSISTYGRRKVKVSLGSKNVIHSFVTVSPLYQGTDLRRSLDQDS